MRKYLLIILLYPSLVYPQTDSITVKVPIGDPTGIAPMGTRFMLLAEPSAIRYVKINADNTIIFRTAADMLTDIGGQPTLVSATNIKTVNGNNLLGSGDVSISSAVAWGGVTGTLGDQTDLINALNLKAPLASPTFTGTVGGITKSMVGLSNVDNTTDAGKPVSTAQAAAIALKSSIHVGIDAGANDSYVITASPAPTSYTVGMVVILKANTVNTGAASVNVNGLGVKTIVKRVSTALANGDIPALSFKMLVYDGTNFTLLNPVVN